MLVEHAAVAPINAVAPRLADIVVARRMNARRFIARSAAPIAATILPGLAPKGEAQLPVRVGAISVRPTWRRSASRQNALWLHPPPRLDSIPVRRMVRRLEDGFDQKPEPPPTGGMVVGVVVVVGGGTMMVGGDGDVAGVVVCTCGMVGAAGGGDVAVPMVGVEVVGVVVRGVAAGGAVVTDSKVRGSRANHSPSIPCPLA